MNNKTVSKLLNRSFLLIPIVLIIGTYFGIGVDFPESYPPPEPAADFVPTLDPFLSTWKLWRNSAILFFGITILAIKVYERRKKIKLPTSSKTWLIGLILSIFSYFIGGALVDLTYLGWFLSHAFD